MGKIKYTPQGFSYVDVNLLEIINWGGLGICNRCGKGPFLEMKLVYVLTDTYCEECFRECLKNFAQMSKEDIEYDLKIQKEYDVKWYKAYGVLNNEEENDE